MLQQRLLLPKEKVKTIGIFRALQLGDLLCTVPAFRALRNTYSHAKISLISLPWTQEFVKRFHRYIDEYIEFPGFEGIPEESVGEEKQTIFFKKHSFDLIFQMQGNGVFSNAFIEKIPSIYKVGYAPREQVTRYRKYFKYIESEKEVLRWLRLLWNISIECSEASIDFPLFPQEEKEYEIIKQRFGFQKYIVIHTGAREKKRKWKTEYFTMVADLLSHLGYQIVFTGVAEDTFFIKEIQKQMIHTSYDVSGYTSLGCASLLLKNSQLLITNDTGMSHVASAVGAKSIVIFSAFSDPKRWTPLDTTRHIAVSPENAHPSVIYNLASLFLGHRTKLAYIPSSKTFPL